MPESTAKQTMSWLVTVEDDPRRADALRHGSKLLAAAVADGIAVAGKEDALALTLLSLQERGFVRLDYPTLEVDQGPEIFRGQPAYHLHQVLGIETTPAGRAWSGPAGPSQVITIRDFAIGQLALGDIHNTTTLIAFVEALEHAVADSDAPAEAKAEAAGWLRRFRATAQAGGDVAKTTGVDLLAKIISHAIGLPPA